MSLAVDILLWLLLGLGILFITVVWGIIVAVCVTAAVRFAKEYKKASIQLEKEEKEGEGPPLYY
ncbi:membrane protein [Gordonia phage Secretariat]|uniref:Membrane protein n=1 Tax=Gordonia phage Secretariat TaxID=2725616 RepID=A0A6M3T9P6_9CAUD|nr:membrane protein [Gordonia phage Secretariat]QJD49624.1 membrane protein [Gordonia phage Secretariat]